MASAESLAPHAVHGDSPPGQTAAQTSDSHWRLSANTTLVVVAAVIALIAIIVIIGWLFRLPRLVQLAPQWVPMQFNTAIGLVLLAAGLAAKRLRLRVAANALAAVLALLGVLTLFQYATGVSLFIDELFVRADLVVKTSHPGRMAPNTALCLCLSAGTLTALRGVPAQYQNMARPILSAAVVALAGAALVGYITATEAAYGWGVFTRMALHTSIAFLLAAGALLLRFLADAADDGEQLELPAWIVPSAAIVAGVLSLTVWQAELAQDRTRTMREVHGAVSEASSRLERGYSELVATMHQLTALLLVGDAANVRRALDQLPAHMPIAGRPAADEAAVGGTVVTTTRPLPEAQLEVAVTTPTATVLIGTLDLQALLLPAEEALAGVEILLQPAQEPLAAASSRLSANQLVVLGDTGWRLHGQARFSAWRSDSSYLLLSSLLIVGLVAGAAYAARRASHHAAIVARMNDAYRGELSLRRQLETELRRSNDELVRFASTVSHDLNEPLRTMKGFAQILERRLGNRLSKENRSHLDRIIDAVGRMHGMITDLLELARVDSRGDELSPVDPHEAVNTALANLHSSVQDTDAQIEVTPLPLVLADRTQLTQLFQNLIGNALKFHGAKPPTVHVSAQLDEMMVWFTVADNGIGFDMEQADRIFAVFQRLHGADEYPGTGIGLSLVKRIVDRHGGTITAHSTPNEGARFTFSLRAG